MCMPQIKIPGNVDNILKNVCVCIQYFLNFRMSEDQLKKQAMSAAVRKQNERKRKMEQINDDEKMSTV